MKEKDKFGEKKSGSFAEKLMGNDVYRKIIIAACFIGIALIFLSGFFKNNASKPEDTSSRTTVTAEQYAAGLETKLTDIVGKISGAGKAKVLVTLERGTEYVYAKEEKKSNQDKSGESGAANETNDSTETKYILVEDADGTQKALAVTEVQPIIKGVVVVCDGGDDPTVQQNIMTAVTTALDITSVRVCVLKAQ